MLLCVSKAMMSALDHLPFIGVVMRVEHRNLVCTGGSPSEIVEPSASLNCFERKNKRYLTLFFLGPSSDFLF